MARAGWRISGGPVQGAGRRPGGAAAEAGSARLFRRSRNGLRLAANPCRGSKNPSPVVGRGEVQRDQPQTLGCWWLGL